ncbi:MAG: lipopolysaccharide heptosyltransferase II [Bacteroidota bacterium]
MDIKQIKPKRILYYQPYNIGDVVLSTPLIRALKNAYPEATIDIMVLPKTAGIAKCIPHINQVIVYNKDGDQKLKGLWQLGCYLRKQHYDLAITTSHSTRSALVTWLSGARYRIGSPLQGGFLFLTHPVREEMQLKHQSEVFLEFLKPLGIENQDSRLELHVNPEDIQNIRRKLSLTSDRPILVVSPFGKVTPTKNWAFDNCSKFLKMAASQGDLYLIGAKIDQPELEKINSLARGVAQVLGGILSLGELVALIKIANVVVTVDAGPLHIGNAVNTPVVALWGPSVLGIWGPRGNKDIIIRHQLDCQPCQKYKTCMDTQCMKSIQAEEVYAAVTKILQNSAR